ncbi:MAG: hypothetical protein M1824_005932 [Vezdaea acicularis]|nr:MAG: hypothetical protein M1824_005932 [Vezdaea acicularis]
MEGRQSSSYGSAYNTSNLSPRSQPWDSSSLPSQDRQRQNTPENPSVRRMRIDALLNHNEEDSRQDRPNVPGWTTPSPSDATPSLPDAVEERDPIPEPRENRPAYVEEEDTFIWYHRDDRNMKWEDVSAAFNDYFGKDRARFGLQGIQGRYYRILKDENIPKLRARPKRRHRQDYGVIKCTNRRYPWMREWQQER